MTPFTHGEENNNVMSVREARHVLGKENTPLKI